ncbi:MAG: SapC family protein [Thermodesulfobacteriota bacterium]
MFQKIVPFNTQAHGHKKIKPVDTFHFVSKTHISSLLVSEFKRAAEDLPIVFLKDGENYGAYALLGLKPGQNLFVNPEGEWTGRYIPAIIRRYPFALGKGQGQDQFLFCIDEESPFISDTEGEPLVGPDGKPSEVVEKAKTFLTEIYRYSETTARFCKEIAEKGLLKPMNMQMKHAESGQVQSVTGAFAVDEKQLNELPDEEFLAFRKNGALPLIYAHLFSLSHIQKLIRKQKKSEEKPA